MTERQRMTKAEQTEATTARLIDIARAIFTRDGYGGTATEEIVAQAGVTRGALYHHFGSKEGLFKAVVAAVQADVGTRVARSAEGQSELWEQLIAGCDAFLEASLDAQVQRIMLVDAPAVLGWATWREMDAANSMQSLREVLAALMAQGDLPPLPLDALTHLLSGAMNEAAMWIASASAPEQALREAQATLRAWLAALRQP
jgi:AcrR family transcriptional regulator